MKKSTIKRMLTEAQTAFSILKIGVIKRLVLYKDFAARLVVELSCPNDCVADSEENRV